MAGMAVVVTVTLGLASASWVVALRQMEAMDMGRSRMKRDSDNQLDLEWGERLT